MTCDPNTLSSLSTCLRCLTNAQLIFVRTYLLCQWVRVVGSVIPNAPTNPDITVPSTAANIVVTWTNSTPIGLTNEVWKSSDGVTFNLFATVSGGTTQVTDATGLAVNTFAYYKVRSCDGSSCSAFSNTISACNTYTSPNVASISFPTLIRAFSSGGTAFMATGLAALTSVSLPTLKRVDGNLDLSNNPGLTSVTLTALSVTFFGLFLNNNNLTGAVSLPAFTLTGLFGGGGSDFQLQSNPLMTSFSAPLMTAVGGIFAFFGCTGLTSINVPILASVGGQTGGGRLDFNGCTSLTSASFPALTSIQSNFVGNGCTVLASLSIPQLILTNGTTINFSTDALNAASINQILARGVASGVTTCTFTLNLGTNSAPTGQGVTDKATLITAGNTVTTN